MPLPPIRSIGLACLAALFAILLGAPRAHSAEDIRIVAGRNGTPWHAFASGLAGALRKALPETKVRLIRRGNGYWNPIFVNSRRAEFGLSNVASASWAYRGNKIAYNEKKYQQLRAVMGGLRPVWITAMLRESYIRRTGFFSLDQALTAERGAPRIVMEPAGSMVPIIADMILAAMGSSRQVLRERGGDVLQVGAQQIPSMIRDDRVDLYFEAAVADHPVVLETALTGNVRFVDLPERALTVLEKSGLKPRPLAALVQGPGRPGQRGRHGHDGHRPSRRRRGGRLRDGSNAGRAPRDARPDPRRVSRLRSARQLVGQGLGRPAASRCGEVLSRTRLVEASQDRLAVIGTRPGLPRNRCEFPPN